MNRSLSASLVALAVGAASASACKDAPSRSEPPAGQEEPRRCNVDDDCAGFTGQNGLGHMFDMNRLDARCLTSSCNDGWCTAVPDGRLLEDDAAGDCARPRCIDGVLTREFANDAPAADDRCQAPRCEESNSSPLFGPGTIVCDRPPTD
jgi:hypothetical protein